MCIRDSIKPVRETRLYEAIAKTLDSAQKTSPVSEKNETPKNPETPEKAAKIEILVAEDFPLNRDVISLMLADTNYKPIFAMNGLEAVKLYKDGPDRFPVIIMDVSMPVMDGHEATGLIQSFENENSIAQTPVIALTGHTLKNDREECLKAGMCDYLSKPVKQSEILEKLGFWVDPRNSTAKSRVA